MLAALPGGDPLAAALAAGETPPPELVAAAGASEAVPVRWAWAGLVVVLVSIVATPHLARQMHFSNRVGLEKPPVVLQDRARELLRRLGHGEAAVDWASGYAWDADYVRNVERTDPVPERWDRSGEGAAILQFWYREGPRPLVSYRPSGRIHHDQPPVEISGMATLKLDMQGRLVALTAVPPQLDHEAPSPERPDWDVLLDAAGLDAAALTPTAPRWNPPVYAGARAA